MNAHPKAVRMEDMKAKLSTLWIFVMFNMIFADIFSFMYPGFLKQIVTGTGVDGTQITPGFLLMAAVLTEVSIAMVFLSRLLPYRANRWANVSGAVFTILWVVVGGGWTMLHYIFFASIEVVCCLIIIWLVWQWRPGEG